MELPRRWLTKADSQRPLLTVVWNPDRVSFCLWGPQLEGGRQCLGRQVIPGHRCSWKRFHEALRSMLRGQSRRGMLARWAMIEEIFPENRTGLGEMEEPTPCLPEWIMNCLRKMPVRLYPDSMTSGLKALSAGLADWPEFAQIGTGIVFELEKRLVFLGNGGERGNIQRISRVSGGQTGELEVGISQEWICQTESFYRMRVGVDLRHLIIGRYPDGWGTGTTGWEDFLHSVLARRISGLAQVRGMRLWGPLRRQRRLVRHVQGSSFLMAASLVLTLNGACQHKPGPDTLGPADRIEWLREKQRWEDANRVWREEKTARERVNFPYFLVGKIAHSLPDNVILDRIHIVPADEDGKARSVLEIEGTINGATPTSEIREWIQQLPEISAHDRIRNLRYTREGGDLRFSVSSTVKTEDP